MCSNPTVLVQGVVTVLFHFWYSLLFLFVLGYDINYFINKLYTWKNNLCGSCNLSSFKNSLLQIELQTILIKMMLHV